MVINMTDEKPKEPIWTCQICGRPIKAKNGIIAHHGYKRPGDGWQTASCAGAREKPYEISCNVLPPTIASIKAHIARVETKLENHMNNPPKTLTIMMGAPWSRQIPKEVTIPKNFDSKKLPCCLNELYCYEGEFIDIKRRLQQDIKYSKQDLIFMEERLKNWVAPSQEKLNFWR